MKKYERQIMKQGMMPCTPLAWTLKRIEEKTKSMDQNCPSYAKIFLSVLHWSNVREQEEKFEVMKFVKDLV